jgi:hypothetical protein
MASAIEDVLARVNSASGDVQDFANALAQKIQQGGDIAVRTSNSAYGAAAGAKAGSITPTTIPPAVKYGGLALLAYLFLRRR